MVGKIYKGFTSAVDDKQQLQKVYKCYRWQVEVTKGLQVLQTICNIYKRSIDDRNQLHDAFWLFFQLCKDDTWNMMIIVA